MAEKPLIQVEGLTGLIRALNALGDGVRVHVRQELVAAAQQAAAYAVFIARQKGLYESGELIASIKAGWRSYYAYIADTAERDSRSYPEGFNYPAIYEYGGSSARRAHGADWLIRNRSRLGVGLVANFGVGEGHVGPRAFLEPAAEAGKENLIRSFQLLFDRLAREAGLETTSTT